MEAPRTPVRMEPELLRDDGGAVVSPIAAAAEGSSAGFSGAVSPVRLSAGTTLDARLELSSVGPTVFQPRVIVANDGRLPESLSAPARDTPGSRLHRSRPQSRSGQSFAVDTATSAVNSPARREGDGAAAERESKAHRIARISVEFEQHQADLVANERASRARKQPFERAVSQSVRAMLRHQQGRLSADSAAATSQVHGGTVYRSEADAASYGTVPTPTAASRPISASRVRPWSAASRGVSSSAASSRPPSAQKRRLPPDDPSLEPLAAAPPCASILHGIGLRQHAAAAHDGLSSMTMNDAAEPGPDRPRPVSADAALYASVPTSAPAVDEAQQRRPVTSMSLRSRGGSRNADASSHQRCRPSSALASQVRIARKALAVDAHDESACEDLAMKRTGAARSAVYQAAAAPGPIGFSFSGDRKATKKKFAFSSQRMEGAAEAQAAAANTNTNSNAAAAPTLAAANDGVPVALSAESIALRTAVHRAQEERDSRTPANPRTRLSLVGDEVPASRDYMPEAPVHQSRTQAMELKVAASPSSRASRVRMVFSAPPTPQPESSAALSAGHRSGGNAAAFELPTPSKVSSVVSGADIARMRHHEHLAAAAEAEAASLEHSVLPPQPVVSPIRRSVSPGHRAAANMRSDSVQTTSSAAEERGEDEVDVPFAADATGDARRAAAAGQRGLVTLARSMRRESHHFWMTHRPPASTVAMFEHRATVRARERTRQAEAPVWAGPFHGGIGGRDVSPQRQRRGEQPSYLERVGYTSPQRRTSPLQLGGRVSLTQPSV